LNEEPKPSQVHMRDQAEYIEELQQLIRDLDALFEDRMPYTWHSGRDGLLLRERIKELGITQEGKP
jgi:hypothetical protein